MSGSTCINHPIKAATARCKRCGKPLCNDCKIQMENGIFCSQECYTAVQKFQEKVKDPPIVVRKSLIGSLLKTAVLAAVVLGGIYYIFQWRFHTQSFGDILNVIKGWF